MVQKAHLQSKNYYTIFLGMLLLFLCCNTKVKLKDTSVLQLCDISKIPRDTVNFNEFRIKNGIAYIQDKQFSGIVKEEYSTKKLKSIYSYLNGKLCGISKTFYENGKLKDHRSYYNNLANGRHFGFWENGKMKFDFLYINEKNQGLQKQWYQSGQKYIELNYDNDTEVGIQKAWRENGKLFINYEAKNGHRYGLQKSSLCYTLIDEQIKSSNEK